MASGQTRPEPMNASPYHSKVKVSTTLADPIFVAGTHVSGKMEMECRADKGLGIGIIMVELFASQELTSRDHSATSTFLHSRRLFQGPGLPPSNAVQAHTLLGDPPLPLNYYQARRGVSTFLFRIPIPSSAPPSISFGPDLAQVKYEVRASVGVFWKGEKRLVTNKKDIEIVEGYEHDFSRTDPEAVVVGEHGKIWSQARLVGGVAVAGESACVELQVKNHSNKKNTGLVLSLTRNLVLSGMKEPNKAPLLQLSDVLTTVPFRGTEYIIPPGAEGVASLVFDVPKHARGVRGGMLEGDESEARTSESLFEIRCMINIKMTMGIGSKDINLDFPVTIVHPAALPESPLVEQYGDIPSAPYPQPYLYPALPMSPPIPTYVDQDHIWLPPPVMNTPQSYHLYSPPVEGQPYYFPPPPTIPVYLPTRPLSAEPQGDVPYVSGIPSSTTQHLLPLETIGSHSGEPEEGKGERASRVAQHLRLSSRHRSVSPRSHRFPLPASNPLPIPPSNKHALRPRNLPPPPPIDTGGLGVTQDAVVHSPRPLLSPKHSYTEDPITHNSVPKSERVEELERMAAEVMATTTDLSADIPKVMPEQAVKQHLEEININKTLPAPPPPTGGDRRVSPLPQRTRVDTYFTQAAVEEPEVKVQHSVRSDTTPPTPTLMAVTPIKLAKQDYFGSGPGQESGLDALERRLLAEVGTRKVDGSERRPDVRNVVQPIVIPVSKEPHEALNDSAISSLTLAGEHEHDSDEKTHRAGKSSVSGDERAGDRGRRKGKTEDGKSLREEKKRGGKKKEKDRCKDGEGHRARKSAAKGRVAAWLGEIDPEIPPPEEVVLPGPSVTRGLAPSLRDGRHALDVGGISQIAATGYVQGANQDTKDSNDIKLAKEEDVANAPNPRSSGFVPIGTLKRDVLQRRPPTKETSVVEEARQVQDLWSSATIKERSPAPPLNIIPAVIPQSIRTDILVPLLPFSAPPEKFDHAKNKAQLKQDHVKKAPPTSPKKIVQPSSRQLNLPPAPRVDPEVKYDIRSARGGRGGRVTAVASIWASAAVTPDRTPQPREIQKKNPDLSVTPRPARTPTKLPNTTLPSGTEPRLFELAGKRARPVVKSSSVPAVVSSSHATPTLSSTASLARPAPRRVKSSIKIPSTISEVHPQDVINTHAIKLSSSKSAGGGDLVFGQARLRDLIKKYQGQGA